MSIQIQYPIISIFLSELLLRGSYDVLRPSQNYVTATFNIGDRFTTFGLPSDRTSYTLVPYGYEYVSITRFLVRVNTIGNNGSPILINIVYYSYSTQVSCNSGLLKIIASKFQPQGEYSTHLVRHILPLKFIYNNRVIYISFRSQKYTLSAAQAHKMSTYQVLCDKV